MSARVHRNPPKIESEDSDRFSSDASCHLLLHPIALGATGSGLPIPARHRHNERGIPGGVCLNFVGTEGSTIDTSNLPFDEWTSIFSNQRVTGALLDRLTHHVHILEINGESYRLRQSKARRRVTPTPIDEASVDADTGEILSS
ncbi:ATP-binding protein [Methylosinus sp. H3A]|nr:ATP-binding protein [Methylosinus sp. H3A]